MAFIVTDPITNNVVRIDLSEFAPEDIDSVEVVGVTGWPAAPNKFSILRLINGALTWVDPRTPAQIAADIQAKVTSATQARLDAFAQTRNYDGILSACTYSTSAIAKFSEEGQCCVAARDATWAALYALLDAVQAGTEPIPTGFEDIEPLLPVLAWPA